VSAAILEHLRRGSIEIEGRFANSSNTTLLVVVRHGGAELRAVYKPESGERPLWDFPTGLWRREVAAYVVSEHVGLHLVPETVVRTDAPGGAGSLQRFVDEDLQSHYFTLRDESRHTEALQALAAFDVVTNNSDRKSGHVLYGEDQLWAIDHGLCFHEDDKLRTVIWDYGEAPLSPAVVEGLRRLLDAAPPALAELLAPHELAATQRRAAALLAHGFLPEMDEDRPYPPYPWPLV